jgi:hypothetical protein
MMARHLQPNATLTERFGHLLYWLFEGMGLDWRRRGLRHVHSGEINQRIVGLWRRLRSVLERYRAGTLRPPRGRDSSPRPTGSILGSSPRPVASLPQSVEGEACAGRAPRAVACWTVLPRRFGWLRSLLLPESQGCVTAFHSLLHEDAEMQAAIAAAPVQIGRVLRPFCHFLGLEVPEGLRLPKRRRVRKEDTSPRPSPHSGEGKVVAVRRRRRTPREIAEGLMARVERTGKPIDISKVSSVVWGYVVHTPRDENCPPPEIGYASRRWRPPR